MIKNYVLLAVRNLLKKKGITSINIVGLALSMACCIVIYFFVSFTNGLDKFHKKADHIYLVTHLPDNPSGKLIGRAPSPISKQLEQNYSAVLRTTRIQKLSAVVGSGNRFFNESVQFCDPSLFDMFSFPVIWGDTKELPPSNMVITREFAKKYFTEENPVGKLLVVRIGENQFTMRVGAVIDQRKDQSSFHLSLILPYSLLKGLGLSTGSWDFFTSATFIQISDLDFVKNFSDHTTTLRDSYNEMNPSWPIKAFGLEPFKTLSQNAYRIESSISKGFGPPSGTTALIAIGVILLILSSLNYINTALGSATSRLKEIGMRKVMGGSRRSIALQFLTENFLIIISALLIALVVAYFFLTPAFDQLFGFGLIIDLSTLSFWVFIAILILTMTVISGGYPAFYLSAYQPIAAFSGERAVNRRKNSLLQFLVFLQFFLAFVSIVVGLIFKANEEFHKEKNLGYDLDNLLVLNPTNKKSCLTLLNQLSTLPHIQGIAGTSNHIGLNNKTKQVDYQNQGFKARVFTVGDNYLPLLKTTLLKGKGFDSSLANEGEILINQSFQQQLDIAIGSGVVEVAGKKFRVIGVIQDVYENAAEVNPQNMLFIKQSKEPRFLVVKLSNSKGEEAYGNIEAAWREIMPNEPFDAFYQSQIFARYFELLSGHSTVMSFTAVFTILLSCFGLFGMVSLKISDKMKDFSIMKILGATSKNLTSQILRMYMGLLLLAIVIGVPSSIYIAKHLFSIVYKNHIPIGWHYPIVGSVIMILVALFTTFGYIVKLVRHNPLVSVRAD